MSVVDWLIVLVFFSYTVWDGTRAGSKSENIRDFFLAGRNLPWWAMGLSIMATQASAITFISTSGLAFMQDMRFVQVYFAVPFAMVILCATLVPFYYRSRAYTAYEVLETRFGLPTRLATSGLFLLSRSLATGTIIAAPSYVLSLILGLPLRPTIIVVGFVATIYTMIGGISGVIRTDVKQMAVMMLALLISFVWIWKSLPDEVGLDGAFQLAGSLGKLKAVDWSLDLAEPYSVWSGLFAALFLMLSYFGTDQTQVQRYLTSRSLDDSKYSLLLSAVAKVPMQFFILLLGVLLFVFYIYNPAPITFRSVEIPVDSSEIRGKQERERAFNLAWETRKEKATDFIRNPHSSQAQGFIEADKTYQQLRSEHLDELSKQAGRRFNDTNYVFPYFILNHLPVGIIGLIVAAIMAAAFSSIDSELNALATCSVVDWYQRLHQRKKSDAHYLKASRLATLFWGFLATSSAVALGETSAIIELVNQIGSYFYGSLLGVFVLLFLVPKAGGKNALLALASGMVTVFLLDQLYWNGGDLSFFFFQNAPIEAKKAIAYLWLNPVGTFTVVFVGWFSSLTNNMNEE